MRKPIMALGSALCAATVMVASLAVQPAVAHAVPGNAAAGNVADGNAVAGNAADGNAADGNAVAPFGSIHSAWSSAGEAIGSLSRGVASGSTALGSSPQRLGSLAPVLQPLPTYSEGKCAPNIVINIPGGGNTFPFLPATRPTGGYTSTLGANLRAEHPGQVTDLYVNYKSLPGVVRTYEQARQDGYDKAVDIVTYAANNCPSSTFQFFGYSMGADIAARLTSAIGRGVGPISSDRVSAAVFMANPNRGVSGVTQLGDARNEHGAFGALPEGYGDLTAKVADICRSGDQVCDTDRFSDAAVQAAVKSAILAPDIDTATGLVAGSVSGSSDGAAVLSALPAIHATVPVHNNYFAINGVGLAQDFISQRLVSQPHTQPVLDDSPQALGVLRD